MCVEHHRIGETPNDLSNLKARTIPRKDYLFYLQVWTIYDNIIYIYLEVLKIKNVENVKFYEDYVEIYKYSKSDNKTKIIIVDLEDVDKVRKISFYGREKEYVQCGGKPLHRIVLNYKDSLSVDHINGNTLDNRKNNLRIVTQSINQRNLHNFRRNNTGVIGIQYRVNDNYRYFRVSWREKDGKRKTKQFNVNKLGKEKAFEMSKDYLRERYLENDYIVDF